MFNPIATVVCLSLILVPSLVAQPAIAVVNMKRLFEAHPESQAAEKRVATQQKASSKKVQAKVDELKSHLDQYHKVAAALRANSGGTKTSKQAEAEAIMKKARKAEADVAVLKSQTQKEIADLVIAERKKILAQIKESIRNFNKERNYNLILDASAISSSGIESIVLTNDIPDITEAVLGFMKKK